MIQGFKAFIMRGNVIDLAVAVVIGAAFTAVVTAIVESVFNPLIGAIFNADSLKTSFLFGLSGGGELALGAVLAAVINFLLIAAVVYFAFVLPINRMKQAQERRLAAQAPGVEEAAPLTDIVLLSEIRDLLAASTGATAHPHVTDAAAAARPSDGAPKHTL
ncbi:large conductance mechanosensitive channel protein MscL [Cryobacterium sp.]|jgi:large conductance mechanosensitive channel|uniref:large conductance mechanosensitive channel protein MscL n=1 Tax=Cryobacterium sp. TaxID=1926290 RepID=UPI002630AE9B|nr:large conductance mechanosensitive channel protein MscL [Cryobacterium sp.]MCU1447226.1 mechanosensitive ion channel protein MscL [Cryobacterium sp.]